jgi:hypothetical protein
LRRLPPYHLSEQSFWKTGIWKIKDAVVVMVMIQQLSRRANAGPLLVTNLGGMVAVTKRVMRGSATDTHLIVAIQKQQIGHSASNLQKRLGHCRSRTAFEPFIRA